MSQNLANTLQRPKFHCKKCRDIAEKYFEDILWDDDEQCLISIDCAREIVIDDNDDGLMTIAERNEGFKVAI